MRNLLWASQHGVTPMEVGKPFALPNIFARER